MSKELTGQCACGQVRFRVRAPKTYGACHCRMCRRWTGGVWMGVVCEEVLEVSGVSEWRSSKIGSRGYCDACGSSVWHKPRHSAQFTFGQGLFDDQDDWRLTREIFTNGKPDHCALAKAGQTALTGWGTIWAVLAGKMPR